LPPQKAASTLRRVAGAAQPGRKIKPEPAAQEAKPDKPVYKAGWARPKHKAAYKGPAGKRKEGGGPAHIQGRPAAAKAKRPSGPSRPAKKDR
jgi:hypothetical protein